MFRTEQPEGTVGDFSSSSHVRSFVWLLLFEQLHRSPHRVSLHSLTTALKLLELVGRGLTEMHACEPGPHLLVRGARSS